MLIRLSLIYSMCDQRKRMEVRQESKMEFGTKILDVLMSNRFLP